MSRFVIYSLITTYKLLALPTFIYTQYFETKTTHKRENKANRKKMKKKKSSFRESKVIEPSKVKRTHFIDFPLSFLVLIPPHNPFIILSPLTHDTSLMLHTSQELLQPRRFLHDRLVQLSNNHFLLRLPPGVLHKVRVRYVEHFKAL